MIKKILLSLDGSELAEKALPHATALAQKFEAELFLVWVLPPVAIMSGHGEIAHYESNVLKAELRAKNYLRKVEIGLLKLDLTVHIKILQNRDVAGAIIDLAGDHAVDLVVMSTHGRSGFSRWVYGSVANKVLQQAPCPVFLVRANESES